MIGNLHICTRLRYFFIQYSNISNSIINFLLDVSQLYLNYYLLYKTKKIKTIYLSEKHTSLFAPSLKCYPPDIPSSIGPTLLFQYCTLLLQLPFFFWFTSLIIQSVVILPLIRFKKTTDCRLDSV